MFVVAGLVSVWCSTAFAGEPAWCKGEDFGASEYTVRGRDEDYRTTVRNIVDFSCSKNPALDPKRPEMEKLRAEVSKELFMNDADWTDAVAYIKESGFSDTEDVIQITEKTLASLTPMDQYVATRYGFRDDGGYGAGANGDPLYRTDALDDVLTEAGRLGFLEHCHGTGSTGREDSDVFDWAVCAEDVQKFDGAKFANELRIDTAHPGKQKTMLHIRAGEVMQALKDIGQRRDKLFKKDDAYKKVFEVAQKGRDDWRKGVGTNKDLLSLVQAMESARWFHSRKQFAGCEDKTQKALSGAAAKIPAKLFKNMYDERDDPFHGFANKAAPVLVISPSFHLAATAFALCQPESGIGAWLGGDPRSRCPDTAARARQLPPRRSTRSSSSTTRSQGGAELASARVRTTRGRRLAVGRGA